MSNPKSLVVSFADRFGVEPKKLLETLKKTAFKQSSEKVISDEQMMALLVVANEHGLNPFTREIYAFPDKMGGIVPVVGVDGWMRIMNNHSDFDSIEFKESPEMSRFEGSQSCPAWIDALIYRKSRQRPTVIREYLDEVYRAPFKNKDGRAIPGPWQTHTKRMLRHKALIQCARVAFSYSGIFDEDEVERIIENQEVTLEAPKIPEDKVFNTKAEKLAHLISDKKNNNPEQEDTPEPVPTEISVNEEMSNKAVIANDPSITLKEDN